MSSPIQSSLIRPLLAFAALAGSAAHAGDFTDMVLVGDSNTGISTGLTYTAKADFNGGTTINGVSFSDSGTIGTGYTLNGTGGVFGGFGNTVSGSVGGAVSNFFYTSDGSGNASMTLSDLTPGTKYVTSWYNAAFGGSRYVDITPSDTGTAFRFNEDTTVATAGNVLRYAFTATASTITFNFDAVSDGDSFHHYAMTNAVQNDGVFSYTHFTPVAPTVTQVSNNTTPFTVSNTDLLQTQLSGITTTGNLNREGVLGAPAVLANGAFSITGVSENNPELITGENNSSVTFTLNTTTNTLGYDVTSIAGYGGWNDGGRDRQRLSIFVSQVNSADWILYGQLDADAVAAGSRRALSAVFNGSISGVDAVRIDFLDGQENGYAGYGEFDVFGTATVPEPSAGLLALAGLGLMTRRRRAV